jgi:hypothetical protein
LGLCLIQPSYFDLQLISLLEELLNGGLVKSAVLIMYTVLQTDTFFYHLHPIDITAIETLEATNPNLSLNIERGGTEIQVYIFSFLSLPGFKDSSSLSKWSKSHGIRGVAQL